MRENKNYMNKLSLSITIIRKIIFRDYYPVINTLLILLIIKIINK